MSAAKYAGIVAGIREALTIADATSPKTALTIKLIAAEIGADYAHVQDAIRWQAYQLTDGERPIITSSRGAWLGTAEDLRNSAQALRQRAHLITLRAKAEELQADAAAGAPPQAMEQIRQELARMAEQVAASIEAFSASPRMQPEDRNAPKMAEDAWGDIQNNAAAKALANKQTGRKQARRKPWAPLAWQAYRSTSVACLPGPERAWEDYTLRAGIVNKLAADCLASTARIPGISAATWCNMQPAERETALALSKTIWAEIDAATEGKLTAHITTKGGRQL